MDHLVREIKENLKLGAPPPTPAVLQTEPAPPHHSPAGGKMKGSSRGGGWGGPVRHRASPYHVPPRSVVSVACDSAGSGPGGVADPTPESMAALRRKWASGRRRYPSTCMNNNAAAAAKAAKNIDPDDPFAILQV